jgi:hypothetical protein
LSPRIPKNISSSEDDIIPRVCVSKSLKGCLESTDIYRKHKRIYVHTCNSNNIIQPLGNQVHDAYLFGEEWILEPVEMKLFTILYINKVIINEQYSKWILKDKDEITKFSIYDFDYDRVYNNK